MPRIALQVDQHTPAAQDALRGLTERLPEHVHVRTEAAETWVQYPDTLGEAGVREVVAAALAELDAETSGVFLEPSGD
jgi:hypothetical protein